MPIDLIIYAVVAAALVFWLRNTLGSRHGEERERPNPLEKKINIPTEEDAGGKIVAIKEDISALSTASVESYALPKDIFERESAISELHEFMIVMPRFDIREFLDGAREAFPMIVEAFAKGDILLLKELLSPTVFRSFEHEIEARGARGETVTTEVHAVKSVKIRDIKRIDRMVYIKLRFLADETSVVRDREGVILSGNPDRITVMNDVWTFGRDIRSKDPTWYLYQTEDDAMEVVKTQMPDAGEVV